MKKNIIAVMLLVFLTLTAAAQVIDTPLARVKLTKLEVITQKMFDRNMKVLEAQLKNPLTEEQKDGLLESMINEVLVEQAADRDGIDVKEIQVLQYALQSLGLQADPTTFTATDAFKTQFKQQTGMGWNVYYEYTRKKLVQQQYILYKKKSYFEDITAPTEEEIKVFYNENETEFFNPALVRFSHVFFDTRNESEEEKLATKKHAESVRQKIVKNINTFEEIVRLESDDATSKVKSGDLGFHAINDPVLVQLLGMKFMEQVFDLKKGTVSPVIKSKIGYHLVRVTEKTNKRFLSLDDSVAPNEPTTVRQYIKKRIALQKQQNALQKASQEIVQMLREDAEITVY